MVEGILFVIAGLAALAGAVTVVVARNPVYSAVGLLGTLFSGDVLYVLQLAHLGAVHRGQYQRPDPRHRRAPVHRLGACLRSHGAALDHRRGSRGGAGPVQEKAILMVPVDWYMGLA